MPELPEVETVRRMLEAHVVGRRISALRTSGKRLRFPFTRGLRTRVRGATIERLGRRGKYLLFGLDHGLTLLSHLGMSGRWLFYAERRRRPGTNGTARIAHVHVRIAFEDGAELWFQDIRRFGMLEMHATPDLTRAKLLAGLGPDPFPDPPSAETLREAARGRSASVKAFIMDQRVVAGVGNIYASEILHRARVHPGRPAKSLTRNEWAAVRKEMRAVLTEAVDNFGTTFSLYRTVWNEPGNYAERLHVYDRAGEPCRACGTAIVRTVLGQRSTFHCPRCQRKRAAAKRTAPEAAPPGARRTRPPVPRSRRGAPRKPLRRSR